MLLLLFQVAPAQKRAKELGLEKYAAVSSAAEASKQILGADAIIVVNTKDSMVFKKVLGNMDEHTISPLEGSSQWLTTALILQLVDEGKLSLEDKVSHYIPIYSVYGKNYITIRHCLSHNTGIQAEGKRLMGVASRKKFNSLEDEVNDFAKREIRTNPGTEFRYSDIGFKIASRIAEIVTKKRFEMLIRQKLFVPLGMRQTTFVTLDGSPADAARGAQSTAADYAHFLEMLLQNGSFNGQQIISGQAVKLMRTIQATPTQIKNGPNEAQGFSYSLGGWAMDANQNGIAANLTNPGPSGFWPVVDFCNGFACFVFAKNSVQGRKDLRENLLQAVRTYFHSACN